ncbi:hypothetical protein ACQ4PT_027717 [Festuca glaucescens]
MASRSICKFFVNGACFKGDYCQFSHDWNDQPNDVCTFYQNGVCSYGSRCRYEHVEVSVEYTPPSTTAALEPCNSSQIFSSSGCPLCEGRPDVCIEALQIRESGLAYVYQPGSGYTYVHRPAPRFDHEDSIPEDENILSSTPTESNQTPHPLAHLPICSSAAAVTCPYGEECPQMHGDLCTTCRKQCLHPHRPSEMGAHIKLCKRNNNRLETLKKSEEIECSVCLDRVLSKPTAAEKRFGLLPECDHAFCITCIRKWRSSSVTSATDIDSTVKACPICRKVSYYVIPSSIWYSSKEEKQDIINGYKAKLKSIDCRYFDFGRDTCPFGGRCFYKHAYTDGRLEEPAPVAVIHFHANDGSGERARNIGLVLSIGLVMQIYNVLLSDRKSWLRSRLAYLLSRLHL